MIEQFIPPQDQGSETEVLNEQSELERRNERIREILDPESTLPEADVYPFEGTAFGPEDLKNVPEKGTLLPVDAATRAEIISL
jgi:hypothetical protein